MSRKLHNIFLTYANEEEIKIAAKATGSSGQGDEINYLEKNDLLARSEIESELKRLRRNKTSVDHIHLSRFDGTNLCQWYGRFSSGFHYPLGRLMKIIEALEEE